MRVSSRGIVAGASPMASVIALSFMAFAACGSRTGLLPPEEEAALDAALDRAAPPDAPADGEIEAEADAARDADAALDADADTQFPDVPPIDICPDAGATFIYLLSQDNTLSSFYPPTLSLTTVGVLVCPNEPNQPYSMAVDRRGIAYSVFEDGRLFRVAMATAACVGTSFAPDQLGFGTFGMGFVANPGGADETLFVDEGTVMRGQSLGLASIDTTSYRLNFVAPFNPPIPGGELTGTSDGRLFAFYTNEVGSGSHIVEVDKTTGAILADYPLQVGVPSNGFAFAFWGGVFWVFTSSASGTLVTQFDPATRTETPTTQWTTEVVGAGVSTCAPPR